MKPRTLRSHLTWIIAIIALIPIVLLGSIQVVQIYQLSQEYTRNQLDSMKRMADAVETYVFYHRTAVETIAADIAFHARSGPPAHHLSAAVGEWPFRRVYDAVRNR
ncbi:UNVERIFIED_CONTAM: putative paraquat-inducible protein A [Brevibacillus sp. OAP136]